MVGQRFSISNFDQFKRSFESVIGDVGKQNVLKRVFPEFYNRLMNEYKNTILNSNKIKPNKDVVETIKNISKSPATKEAVKDTAKAVGKVGNIASKAGILAKIGGRALPIVGGAWTILDPKTTWNQKVLGGMMMAPPTAIPATLGLIGTSIIPKGVDAYYNWKNGTQEPFISGESLVDPHNLDPMLKPLTAEEASRVHEKYNKPILDKVQADAQASIDKGYALANEYQQGINYLDSILNENKGIQRGGDYPAPPNFNKNSVYGIAPSSQNAQEGRLNFNQDNLYLNQNKPSLMGNVEGLDLIGRDLPTYNSWNAGVSTRLQDLQDMVNNQQQQGVQPMQNSAGSDALLQYLQYQNAKNAQAQQQNEAILKQYQDAIRADQKQNLANQLVNSFGVFGEPETKAPIYYIGAKGDMRKVELDQPGRVQPLPTNISSNVEDFAGRLKLQQAMQGKQNDPTAQVLTAQALGDMYNVNPLVFLNPDLAKEYMQGQNTIANTRTTGQERRMDIPLNAQADVIKEDAKTAGKLALDKANAYYDYVLEMLRQSGMNQRQAEQIASQEALNQYIQANQNYRAQMEDARARDLAEYGRGTQLGVASIYAGAKGNQQEDPLQQAYKASQIYNNVYAIQNPQQRQQALDFVNTYLNPQGNQDGVNINPYGTTVDQDNILRRMRERNR